MSSNFASPLRYPGVKVKLGRWLGELIRNMAFYIA